MKLTEELLIKLYDMGFITSQKLQKAETITVSSICRRRLPIVMVRSKMAETIKEAISLVEQGHVRVIYIHTESINLTNRLLTYVDRTKYCK